MLEQRARQQYGLELNPGPFEIDSRPALAIEKFAQSQGKGNEFHDAVMRAYWQQARNIEDRAVLKEIAESVGLNTEQFEAVFDNPEYTKAVEEDIELAQSYGLHAVPALVFDDTYLVSGAQPYAMLKQVVDKIQGEQS